MHNILGSPCATYTFKHTLYTLRTTKKIVTIFIRELSSNFDKNNVGI